MGPESSACCCPSYEAEAGRLRAGLGALSASWSWALSRLWQPVRSWWSRKEEWVLADERAMGLNHVPVVAFTPDDYKRNLQHLSMYC